MSISTLNRLFPIQAKSKSEPPEEVSMDDLAQVRGSGEVPRESEFFRDHEAGRQLMLDGVNMAALGTGGIWTSFALTAPPLIVTGMGMALVTGIVGTEKIEEGRLQMNEAAEKYAHQREEQLHQAEEAQEQELKDLEKEEQEAQEREDDRLIKEAEDLLNEDSAPTSPGNGGAPPANVESYSGELPSFPAEIINAPPPHDPQISIQPIDSGAGNNDGGRIY
jgi:hypothetical protein